MGLDLKHRTYVHKKKSVIRICGVTGRWKRNVGNSDMLENECTCREVEEGGTKFGIQNVFWEINFVQDKM